MEHDGWKSYINVRKKERKTYTLAPSVVSKHYCTSKQHYQKKKKASSQLCYAIISACSVFSEYKNIKKNFFKKYNNQLKTKK